MTKVIAVSPTDWPRIYKRVLPLAQAAIEHAHGDWDIGDFDIHVLRGDILVFLIIDNGEPVTLIAGEYVHYPRYTVWHCLFMAGRLAAYKNQVRQIMDVLRAGGAEHVEACCRPAVTRLAERALGFKKKCDVVRFEL